MEKASIEDQEMPEVLIEEDSAQCSSSSSNNAEMNDEEREGLSKKEKARRKKEKKALKTKEKEAEKEKFREAMSNVPSSREVESAQLNKMLEKEGLVVKDVAADGHCLYRLVIEFAWCGCKGNILIYRAIADQLTLNMNPPNFAESSFVDIRRHAADYMRNHPEQFAPYLCLPGPCDEYSAYCDEVENVNNAKWGGQLEISAIAACLEVPIWVYEVSKPILKMGTDNASAEKSLPIKISYHRHFYSLGEHYNSVVPIQEH